MLLTNTQALELQMQQLREQVIALEMQRAQRDQGVQQHHITSPSTPPSVPNPNAVPTAIVGVENSGGIGNGAGNVLPILPLQAARVGASATQTGGNTHQEQERAAIAPSEHRDTNEDVTIAPGVRQDTDEEDWTVLWQNEGNGRRSRADSFN